MEILNVSLTKPDALMVITCAVAIIHKSITDSKSITLVEI